MRLVKFTAALGLLLAGAQAQASSQSGYVTKVAMADGRFFVVLDGSDRNGASCNNVSVIGTRYEIDSTNAAGQAMISIILSAYSLRKSLYISGTGLSCTTDTEHVGYIEIQ